MRKLLASFLAVGVLAGGVSALIPASSAEASTKTTAFYLALDEKDIPHAGAAKYAKAYCHTADRYGVPMAFSTYVSEADKQGLDVERMAFIIGAGTFSFCPRHIAALKALADA